MFLALLGLLPLTPPLVCAWRFLRARRRAFPPAGRLEWLARGAGFVALWGLPAALLQPLYLGAGLSSSSFQLKHLLLMAPMAWSVLLGGLSVQVFFEDTAKALTGHRQSTMLDNWPYYMALTAVQVLVLGALAAWRLQLRGSARDRVALGIGLAVLVNALAGIPWPWWGS